MATVSTSSSLNPTAGGPTSEANQGMFNCRFCLSNPFAAIFGQRGAEVQANRATISSQATAYNSSAAPAAARSSTTTAASSPAPITSTVVQPIPAFKPRMGDVRDLAVKNWCNYVHPRARNFWEKQVIINILEVILQHIDESEDPVLGPGEKCVTWRGPGAADDNRPIVTIVKPSEEQPTDTYLTRVLAFLFADDPSFDELQEKTKGPFVMACGNQRCILLTHISLDD